MEKIGKRIYQAVVIVFFSCDFSFASCPDVFVRMTEKFGLSKEIADQLALNFETIPRREREFIQEQILDLPDAELTSADFFSLFGKRKPALPASELVAVLKVLGSKPMDQVLKNAISGKDISIAEMRALTVYIADRWSYARKVQTSRTWIQYLSNISLAKVFPKLYVEKDTPIQGIRLEEYLRTTGLVWSIHPFSRLQTLKQMAQLIRSNFYAPDLLSPLEEQEAKLAQDLKNSRGLKRLKLQYQLDQVITLKEMLKVKKDQMLEAAQTFLANRSHQSIINWLYERIIPQTWSPYKLVEQGLVYSIMSLALGFGVVQVATIDQTIEISRRLGEAKKVIDHEKNNESLWKLSKEEARKQMDELLKKLNDRKISREEYLERLNKKKKIVPELFSERDLDPVN